ncbi:MAG: carboxylesterase family protein, partial [Pseudomonadota bacterium]
AKTVEDQSANFAILDQIAALDWISENINVFGGDADNITIFGESAGGHNVATLITSQRAAGKFERAIIQSGSFQSVTLEEAETGTPLSAAPIADKLLGATVTAEGLRSIPLDEFFAAYTVDIPPHEFEPPRIIEDGVVVPEGGVMSALGSQETFNAVPIMTGTNRDETKLFNILDDRLVRWRFGRIPRARDPDVYDAVSEYQSRMWRVSAVEKPAARMAESGHAEVYAYRFDWDDAGKVFGADFGRLFGAAHGLEIPFVFGQFRFLGSADRWVFTKENASERLALSSEMMSYWGEFARSGAPGRGTTGDLPEWRPWSSGAEAPALMFFDSQSGGGTRIEESADSARMVAEDLFADDRLEDEDLTCTVYEATRYWNPELETHDLGGCLDASLTSEAE